MKKILEKFNNELSKKIKIIPNGVDTDIFKPSNNKKNRLIYTGNIGHAQELEKVILAIKKINESIPIEFHIIGEGDLKKKLEELVKKEGLENKVFFKGLLPRDKIPELISESLIGLAPIKSLESLRYAVPTKTYEYMACGIPFIVTGKGEVENLVKSSKAGLLAESTVESIYDKILYLLKNKELINSMGKKGRLFVVKNYDRKKIAENLLNNLQSGAL
jgi:glycosyltransferase involved in cell wall biosynthesis